MLPSNLQKIQTSIVVQTVNDLYVLAGETGDQRGMKGTEGSVTCARSRHSDIALLHCRRNELS